ncbi:leptin receptor overlapping transcript-like 1 [Diaphorina citri]|uniref:Leptin receptor overlapping transcript-like 1 n=1 Tax=Diaphorina citri TaxID=121845 RepID=A0A1S3DBT7_DIACI|nr:leptin receptor overlapping transcript-like 1 [Diaphorina citri]KAI5692945.1 hypothetical protein M8J75_004517 [Diaphorina citri]KAI5708224.1 hypothetical protein M8J77_018582 [Diaphorina citri]KAI5709136.1 hypothetical protein M8J76_011009 [Diaphorina citri]
MTVLVIACVMPGNYKAWYPLSVILFYILAPLPTMLWKRYTATTGSSDLHVRDLAIFITMGIVVSSFGLPLIMSRAPVLEPLIGLGTCYLTMIANLIVYSTYVGFFMTLYSEESDYSMW